MSMILEQEAEQKGAMIVLDMIISYVGRQGPLIDRDLLVHAIDHYRTHPQLISEQFRENWDMQDLLLYEESDD